MLPDSDVFFTESGPCFHSRVVSSGQAVSDLFHSHNLHKINLRKTPQKQLTERTSGKDTSHDISPSQNSSHFSLQRTNSLSVY